MQPATNDIVQAERATAAATYGSCTPAWMRSSRAAGGACIRASSCSASVTADETPGPEQPSNGSHEPPDRLRRDRRGAVPPRRAVHDDDAAADLRPSPRRRVRGRAAGSRRPRRVRRLARRQHDGGGADAAAAGDTARELYLFDTFAGMPPPGDEDAGTPASAPPTARAPAATQGVGGGVARGASGVLVAGYPPSASTSSRARSRTRSRSAPDGSRCCGSTPTGTRRPGTSSCTSTRSSRPAASLIVDDYGYWQGARQAVDEYIGSRGPGPATASTTRRASRSRPDMKLVMTLLVRDEEDILDAQIAFQLNSGVDFVIATDNRSEDGTAEILESYARQGVLHLLREEKEGKPLRTGTMGDPNGAHGGVRLRRDMGHQQRRGRVLVAARRNAEGGSGRRPEALREASPRWSDTSCPGPRAASPSPTG